MRNRDRPSFLTLPVELVHCILDKLDILTILISFRDVCKRFNDIMDKYHRYKVSLRLRFIKEKLDFSSRFLPY